MKTPGPRHPRVSLLLGLAVLTAGCDPTDSTDPFGADPDASPVVVAGQVSAAAAPFGTPPTELSGIAVEVEGTDARALTDLTGRFRLEVDHSDRIRLRFRRGAIDVRFEIDGPLPGDLVELDLTLDGVQLTIRQDWLGRLVEFDGVGLFVSLSGSAPERVLRLDVVSGDRAVTADIFEHRTHVSLRGDLVTFDEILRGVRSDVRVRLEGEGVLRADGSIGVAFVKAEIRDDLADRFVEFDGVPERVALSGTTPERTLRMRVTDPSDGRTEVVDVFEGRTLIARDGDAVTFDEILRALDSGLPVEVEGRGLRQEDGSLSAATIKVEVRRSGDDGRFVEFDGIPERVSLVGTAPERVLRLLVRDDDNDLPPVLVDVLESRTLFARDGDVSTFENLLRALDLNLPLDVEGAGVPQADGSLTAAVIKVEVDD